MAKGFDVLNVKSAVKARNKFDLSRTHLTTMDFGQPVPLFAEETVPGDDITVNASYFSRMAPLVKPTYGKFSFKTITAFVPYHQVADDADAWLAGKTTWEGDSTTHRFITLRELVKFVVSYCVAATVDGVSANGTNSQFTYVNASGTVTYSLFTHKGRYWIKVLNALGYALPQSSSLKTDSAWYTGTGTTVLSAYPLLAFFKAYNDYMSQSQKYNTSALSHWLKAVKHSKAVAGFLGNTGEIQAGGINVMFSNLFLCYENDYFTSAWQNPNFPLGTAESINSVGTPFTSPSTAMSTVADVALGDTSGNITTLGQRALDFLKSFDDWVRRNNYSGSRAVQQVYSRFGIKTDDYRSNYAHVLATDTIPVQVGDVTATASTDIGSTPQNIPLGDYAGKGIMNGGKGVQYKADDYGLLMIIGWYTVVPMNSYGFDRKVLRSQPLDYFNPEFDGLGAEAISAGEYFTSPIQNPGSDSTLDTQVYGYTERYNSYRFGRDLITGDFRDFHSDGDMNVWHTGRNMAAIRQANNLLAQSSSVMTLPQTDSEYNRMFSITDGSIDHFYVTANFGVTAIRPMLNLNQVPRLGEGNTAVPRNGNIVA